MLRFQLASLGLKWLKTVLTATDCSIAAPFFVALAGSSMGFGIHQLVSFLTLEVTLRFVREITVAEHVAVSWTLQRRAFYHCPMKNIDIFKIK